MRRVGRRTEACGRGGCVPGCPDVGPQASAIRDGESGRPRPGAYLAGGRLRGRLCRHGLELDGALTDPLGESQLILGPPVSSSEVAVAPLLSQRTGLGEDDRDASPADLKLGET